MKINKLILASVVLSLFLPSCNEIDPLRSEQYKKQIYIVGAYAQVFTQKVYCNDNAPVETFISLAASGSQGLDEDVTANLVIDLSKIDYYNKKYIGAWSSDPFYAATPSEIYTVPSLKATLKAGGEVFEKIPVMINTKKVPVDSTYAIPFRLESVSAYEMTKDDYLLLKIDLQNQYSNYYAMVGSKNVVGSTDIARTGKVKLLQALSEHVLRMYFLDMAETKANIQTQCMTLTIDAKTNEVTVAPYNAEQCIYTITSSGGSYDPEKKCFNIWYQYTLAGKTDEYRIEEELNLNTISK